MKFRTNYNSKSAALVASIIENEDLAVSVNTTVDALGDTVIVASGSREDVLVLRSVFEMVY